MSLVRSRETSTGPVATKVCRLEQFTDQTDTETTDQNSIPTARSDGAWKIWVQLMLSQILRQLSGSPTSVRRDAERRVLSINAVMIIGDESRRLSAQLTSSYLIHGSQTVESTREGKKISTRQTHKE